MDVKKKPEDYMYDSSDADWSDNKLSDYWKRVDAELDRRLGFKPPKKSFLEKLGSLVKRKK